MEKSGSFAASGREGSAGPRLVHVEAKVSKRARSLVPG